MVFSLGPTNPLDRRCGMHIHPNGCHRALPLGTMAGNLRLARNIGVWRAYSLTLTVPYMSRPRCGSHTYS